MLYLETFLFSEVPMELSVVYIYGVVLYIYIGLSIKKKKKNKRNVANLSKEHRKTKLGLTVRIWKHFTNELAFQIVP